MFKTASRLREGKENKYYSLILPILIPALVENIINTLFGIADTAMLKKTPDQVTSISAVGVTASTNNWVLGITTAFFIGLTVSVAQAYGRGEKEKCSRITARLFPFGIIAALVLSLTFSLGSPVVIRFLGANEEIRELAEEYFRIVAIGYFFHIITVMCTAALRGIGCTKIPMYYNLGSGVLNVFLNWCLIGGNLGLPALGVRGAAIATTLSRACAFVFALIYLFSSNTPVSLRLKYFTGKRKETSLRNTFVSGITSASEQFLLQTGAVLTTMILTVVPNIEFASLQVTLSMENLSWAIGAAFCTVSTTLAGQCRGEGNVSKARKITKKVWFMGLLFALAISLAYFFAGGTIARIYTDDEKVIENVGTMMRICSLTIFGIMTHQVFAGSMRGLGYPVRPLIASLISLWLCRVLGGFLVIRVFSLPITVMLLCLFCDQWTRGGVNLFLYRRLYKSGFGGKINENNDSNS